MNEDKDKNDPKPGPSKARSITPEKRRRRSRSRSSLRSSSSSSSSSGSGSSSSSSSSGYRRRHHKKKRGGKRSRKSHRKDHCRPSHKTRKWLKRLSEQLASQQEDVRDRANTLHIPDRDGYSDSVSLSSGVSRSLYRSVDEARDEQSNENKFTFAIGTKLKEPSMPKTSDAHLQWLSEVQFLDNSDWTEIRYAETQKNYNHSPGFTDLEMNEEVKAFESPRHLIYADKAYAAFTMCILKQRDALQNVLSDFLQWISDGNPSVDEISLKLHEVFLSGEYHKTSGDLLQLACGHRAEILQMRRDCVTKQAKDPLVKATLRKIPPSCSNLFNSEKFSAAIEKAGGVRKCFWPVKKSSVSQAESKTRVSSQEHSHTKKPSQGCCQHDSSGGTNHPHYKSNNPPSRGDYNRNYHSQGYYSHARSAAPNNRASFRGRPIRGSGKPIGQDDSSPEDENTISSASLCMSPSVEKSTIDGAPLCASTPMARPLTNGHDGDKRASNCDTLNGNVNVHIVSESTNSMDVLSGGESDAGDTLNRRNNNSISSTLTGTLRENVNDLPKRRGAGDPTYFVAKELLMTERTYKRDLELVTVTWSSKVSGLTAAGTDVVTALARACLALEPLALPAGGLLAKLEKSLATHNNEDTEDPEYKRIAELLYDYLSNTYEAYTSYIERSGTLVGMVESVRRRSTVADKEIASFDATSPLPLTCLLLRPLHRLLHLERLAIELSDATNSSTALKALDIARRAARDASEQLHHVENHAALCQLQRDIVGYDKLLIADREFIRLGCVYKHSTRGLQQRMLFLFSDVLILASKASSSQFRAHAALPLHLLEVKPTELPHSFTLSGEDVNILLSASNDLEFGSWLHALEFAMENAKDNPIDIDTELTPYELEAGVSTSCHSLSGTTSGGALTHVCWHRVTSLSRDHLHLAMRTQMSGYLLRKFKNSHGWQKLWVVFAAFTLFFYKSWQDRQPLASLPLLGYSVGSPAEADAIHKDFVFKLQFKNHIYFFRADSLFTYHRWTDVLQTAMVHSHHD